MLPTLLLFIIIQYSILFTGTRIMIMQRGKSISILNALNSPAIYIPYNIYSYVRSAWYAGRCSASVMLKHARGPSPYSEIQFKTCLRGACQDSPRRTLTHTRAHTHNIVRRAVQRNDSRPDRVGQTDSERQRLALSLHTVYVSQPCHAPVRHTSPHFVAAIVWQQFKHNACF